MSNFNCNYGWLEKAHTGKGCVILANGPTLGHHDLTRIPKAVQTIGINRSYELKWSKIHVAIDKCNKQYPGIYDKLGEEHLFRPYHWGDNAPGYSIPRTTSLFGLDLVGDGAAGGIGGVGSAAYYALQVAVWLGFSKIWFLGLDLTNLHGRGHFHDGKAQTEASLNNMNNLFITAKQQLAFHKKDVEILIAGSPASKCSAFRKVPYPWRGEL